MKNESLQFKYFFKMGEKEREIVRQWYAKVEAKTKRQKKFLDVVYYAIKIIEYDYRISTIEASLNEAEELYFAKCQAGVRGLSLIEWKEKGSSFAPELNSRLADLYELYLWYSYRIAKGYWSIEFVCDNSFGVGNYCDSFNPSHFRERTGARKVGGFYDGIGNTYRLVSYASGFVLCGGVFYNGAQDSPVAEVYYLDGFPDTIRINLISGVVVLLK